MNIVLIIADTLRYDHVGANHDWPFHACAPGEVARRGMDEGLMPRLRAGGEGPPPADVRQWDGGERGQEPFGG
jgi:hypothetical protein